MAIRAYFQPGEVDVTVHGLYQWDKDQNLVIYDDTLPDCVQVHFAYAGMSEAKCESCTKDYGCVNVAIPDECLTQTTPIVAWVCDPTLHGVQTIRTIVMPVIARTKPGEEVEPSDPAVVDKVVALDATNYNQVVSADTGKLMENVTIVIPETLNAENIREGVDIGGVVGTFKPTTVDANIRPKAENIIQNGIYTIEPDAGADGISQLNLNVNVPAILVDATLQDKTIVANGEYTADPAYDGFNKITVNVPKISSVLQDKTVKPSFEHQTINADEGYDGLKTVEVEAVTSEIDEDIKPENIKAGVEILGVAGELDFTTQTKTVTPTTSEQSVTPDEGFEGLTSVTVSAVTSAIDSDITPANIKKGVEILGVSGELEFTTQTKSVTPTTSEQIVTPDENVDGLTSVTVSAVTSAIDGDIKPENIKKGIDILGVAGELEFTTQTKSVTPTTSEQSVIPDDGFDGLTNVTISAVTNEIDSNIKPENIKLGIDILGVTGEYKPADFTTQEKTATPTTSVQNITADAGYDGLSKVTIEAVTSAIDSNISAENIKKGIDILGVAGSYEFVKQTKTVAPTTSAQTINADNGYDGLGSVTVEAVTSAIDSDIKASNIKKGVNILGVDGSLEFTTQTKTVAPTTSAQTITPDSGVDGLKSVTVSAVTSAIDSDITPANIKKGVEILGVAGELEFTTQAKTVAPTTSEQTVTPDSSYDGLTSVTVSAVTSAIDADIKPANIKKGVNILGVDGSLEFTTQTKSVTPTTSAQTITPDSGVDGLSSVSVAAVTSAIDSDIKAANIKKGVNILGVDGSLEFTTQTKSVTPTTSAQTITPDSGVDGLTRVTVSAVTSAIDSDIKASNIKKGVNILGVDGSLEFTTQTKSVTPKTSAQTITPDSSYNGLSSVSVAAVTSAIDANITAGNIKAGVSILGVTGTAPTYITVASESELANYTSMPNGTLAVISAT